ncbi:MAG TPA: hypothetical protein VKA34_11645 [Balneolales bacterium]|nr:hypothetical protein [Balneolales bacterium]
MEKLKLVNIIRDGRSELSPLDSMFNDNEPFSFILSAFKNSIIYYRRFRPNSSR